MNHSARGLLVCAISMLALSTEVSAATFYSYNISQSLPCNNCNGNITLSGSVTTDGLGSLSAGNLPVWNLVMSVSGETPITITQNNSSFNTVGSTQINATAADLTFTLNGRSDAFSFAGNSNAPAIWNYGLGSSSIFTFFAGATQYTAQQALTYPSTVTASLIATSEVPEPSSSRLLLLSLACFLIGSGYVTIHAHRGPSLTST